MITEFYSVLATKYLILLSVITGRIISEVILKSVKQIESYLKYIQKVIDIPIIISFI